MFGLGIPEIAVIAGVTTLLFGPKMVPELGRSIGQTVRSFQQAAKEFESELKKETQPATDTLTDASLASEEPQDVKVSRTGDSLEPGEREGETRECVDYLTIYLMTETGSSGMNNVERITHLGGCHCGHVRWEALAPKSVVAWRCNCSICSMRGKIGFVVPSTCFKLLADSENFLSTYTFGTHTAKHTFCKVCGISLFYTPRSNPDGIGVTLACVDPGMMTHVEIKPFDAKNWEKSYEQSSIASYSK
ncbi:Sec-independent protein translocase protein tata protein [Thalictrum thalictroides]|uniref:Sec-independent protein translocase protein tata protein n=1 Tax=Thalictrum thalictroides TaxID=46969 RepID=A0A7J6W9Z7_THATH|nr:Sec-independent protein translocase protein tata protein [Thalictrum thalictroides]